MICAAFEQHWEIIGVLKVFGSDSLFARFLAFSFDALSACFEELWGLQRAMQDMSGASEGGCTGWNAFDNVELSF